MVNIEHRRHRESYFGAWGSDFSERSSEVKPDLKPGRFNSRRWATAFIAGAVVFSLGAAMLTSKTAKADGGGFEFDMYGNNPGWNSHRIKGAAILSQPHCGEQLIVGGQVVENPVSFRITGERMGLDRPLVLVITAASAGYDGRKDSVIAAYGQNSSNIASNFNGFVRGIDGKTLPLSADDVLGIAVYEASPRSNGNESFDLGSQVLDSVVKFTCPPKV